MAETNEILSKAFSRHMTGFTLSKAILEDYARVVAKLENVSEQEIKDRVRKRNDELFEEIKTEQREETEASKNQ